jgi:hypothetical protein
MPHLSFAQGSHCHLNFGYQWEYVQSEKAGNPERVEQNWGMNNRGKGSVSPGDVEKRISDT